MQFNLHTLNSPFDTLNKIQTQLLLFIFALCSYSTIAQCPVGDIILLTQADVDNFSATYPGCSSLAGRLTIGPSSDITNLNGLSGVTEIAGKLYINYNSSLVDASGLGNITQIGATGGGIEIRENDALTTIDLTNASAITLTRAWVVNNDILTTALLPNDLVSAISLAYQGNPMLTNISQMPDLISVEDNLAFRNTMINIFPPFSSLTTIGGLYVLNNNNITQLPLFPVLTNFSGTLFIQSNPQLTSIDLSDISTSAVQTFTILDNPVLTIALLPTDVTQIAGLLSYGGNSLLAQISEMEALISAGRIGISNTLLNAFPSFSALTTIETGLFLRSNANITQIPSFPNLQTINQVIDIQSNPNLTDFDLSQIGSTNVEYYQITGNSVLTSALLPEGVTYISNLLFYSGNPLLANISMMEFLSYSRAIILSNTLLTVFPPYSSLTSLGSSISPGGFVMRQNENVAQIPVFPLLNSLSGNIDIQKNTNLSDFDLSHLATSEIGYFYADGNPVLTSALFPIDVTNISQFLRYVRNPLLSNISEMDELVYARAIELSNTLLYQFPTFSNLTSIGNSTSGGFVIRNNVNITQIPEFPVLSSLSGNIDILNNDNLTDFDVSQLTTSMIGYFTVEANPLLTSALFPTGVTEMSKFLRYWNNPLLTEMSEMDQLTHVANYVSFINTAACALPNLTALEYTSNFTVRENDYISTLPTLSPTTVIDTVLDIQRNSNLSYCAIEAVCSYLQSPLHLTVIDNTGDCLDVPAIDAACTANLPYPNDADGDGVSVCDGDCDDNDPNNFPGNTEVCDGQDNDCDGLIDDDDTDVVGQITWYADTDGDGYGDPGSPLVSCNQPSGYVSVATDCDDNSPLVYPGAEEILDQLDNDCNGEIDEGLNYPKIDIGDCATVLLGYAPEECTDLSVSITDGTAPFTFAWSTGESSDAITVCPTETTTYGITVTDANNLTAQDEITVQVIDIRCGNGPNPKILICHYPPGNPDNPQTICISLDALETHLTEHGDNIGICGAVDPCAVDPESYSSINQSLNAMLEADHFTQGHDDTSENTAEDILIYPNPASTELTIKHTQVIRHIRIYAITGEIAGAYTPHSSEISIHLTDLASGTYIVQIEEENGITRNEKIVVMK